MLLFLKKGNGQKGQSTIEYILLVAAIIAIVIAFTVSNNTGLRQHLNGTLDTATNKWKEKETHLDSSMTSADNDKVELGSDMLFPESTMPAATVDAVQRSGSSGGGSTAPRPIPIPEQNPEI